MSADSILRTFHGIFRGNEAAFVRHQRPFKKEGKKLTAAWRGFAKYNEWNPPPEGCAYGDFIPVTQEHYKEHLNGRDGLAIAPITNTEDKRNVCFYAALDIDVYSTNFTWLVRRLYEAGLKFAAFLSKSGGLHIYFFFADAEPADKVIKTLNRIVEVFGLTQLFGKGKVEVFPKQAVFVPGNKNASCLFLPFYNAATRRGCTTKMLTVEGKLVGIVKALPVIESMFVSIKEINTVLDELPYNDAPYCVQAILLSGALAAGDRRNNFLFSAAVYLKKKFKEGFYDALAEMNDCFETPLEKAEVDSVYKSVTEHGYDNYWCTKPPCSDYCDKGLCAKREFGPGKGRGGHFTGADCWGALSKVMAEEPYYLWEVRVKPDEPFKTVRVDSVDDLQNQSTVQKRCWRDLNWAPFSVKTNDWIAIVNNAMEGIEERQVEVSKETDTTETSALRGLFMRYLTHKQAHDRQPYMVQLNLVYHADGAYYFTSDGFKRFLAIERFALRGYNLREQLISYGCTEGEVVYKTARGAEKKIACWKKMDDEELLNMDAFFEDVRGGDAGLSQKDKEEGPDDGTKF